MLCAVFSVCSVQFLALIVCNLLACVECNLLAGVMCSSSATTLASLASGASRLGARFASPARERNCTKSEGGDVLIRIIKIIRKFINHLVN